MTTSRQVLGILRERPRIERLAPVNSQRLPAGRTLVEVEVSGWGMLRVPHAMLRPYWGRRVFGFVVPLGAVLGVEVWSLLGRDQQEYQPEATLAQAPERAPMPNVKVDAFAASLGVSLGHEIGSHVPLSFAMPRPVLRSIEPRVSALARITSRRPRLPASPAPIVATAAKVCMPPVRSERLAPPRIPVDRSVSDSH